MPYDDTGYQPRWVTWIRDFMNTYPQRLIVAHARHTRDRRPITLIAPPSGMVTMTADEALSLAHDLTDAVRALDAGTPARHDQKGQ